MTSFSKSASACAVQPEGRNIDEVSIAMPKYFCLRRVDGRACAYLGAPNERNCTPRALLFHSSYDAPLAFRNLSLPPVPSIYVCHISPPPLPLHRPYTP